MYESGRGVAQDQAEAAKWYRLAADQGFAYAQNALGMMYSNGQGVQQDYVSAYLWFSLAAAQGLPVAIDNRDQTAKLFMTTDQVAEGQRLAREWTPTPKQ